MITENLEKDFVEETSSFAKCPLDVMPSGWFGFRSVPVCFFEIEDDGSLGRKRCMDPICDTVLAAIRTWLSHRGHKVHWITESNGEVGHTHVYEILPMTHQKPRNTHAAGLAAARWGTNRPKSKPVSIHIPAIEAMAAAGIKDRPAWVSALILKELEKWPRKGLPSRKP